MYSIKAIGKSKKVPEVEVLSLAWAKESSLIILVISKILLIEFGVGLTVAGVMLILFHLFSSWKGLSK